MSGYSEENVSFAAGEHRAADAAADELLADMKPEAGIHVEDLGDIGEGRSDEILRCPSCTGEWSATRGDYFMKPAGEPFVCRACGMLLELVRRVVAFEQVKP